MGKNRLFGTDGIRGRANTPPMDSETVMHLGRAAAHVLGRSAGRHRILIGKDTRVSGYMLETALASGITSMGVDVLLVGPLPTPGVAFVARSMRADAGIMISASHNSFEDNGIKFFGADGFKLADEAEAEIERHMTPGSLDSQRADPAKIGKAFRIDDAVGRYVVFLKNCVDKDVKLDGLRLVIDAANGAAYRVAPMVFEELGAEVICIGDEPDGKNINHGCGSTATESLSQKVREVRADLGVAYDGDADRAIFVDEEGNVVDGDLVLAILAQDAQSRAALQGDGIVGTVMSNLGLEVMLQSLGLKLYRSPVGDRYVLAEMRRLGLNLGGEQSGHVISLDHNTTGDGVGTSLLLISALLRSGKRLSEFHNLVERYPQRLENVPVTSKPPLNDIESIALAIQQAENELGESGRVLLRYSGTEAKLRVMVECSDHKLCDQITERLVSVVTSELT